MSQQWDFFIAHAGMDTAAAEQLYGHLIGDARVFLDSRSMLYGDDWDRELPRAQRDSLVTVVLISENSDSAYYQREEIASAIHMARQDPSRHRVVPVFLGATDERDEVPYGLRLKHSMAADEVGGLAEVARRLLELRTRLQERAAGGAVAGAPSDTTGSRAPEWLSASTTGFVGPAEQGPDTPLLVTSWVEYQRLFGTGMNASLSFLPYAVRGYFENGGQRAFVVRVLGSGASGAALTLAARDDQPCLQLAALTPGAWGNRLHVRVQDATRRGLRLTIARYPAAASDTAGGAAAEEGTTRLGSRAPEIQEDYDNLGFVPGGPNYLVEVVNRESLLVRVSLLDPTLASARPQNVSGWLTGGADGAPAGAAEFIGDPTLPASYRTGIAGLEEIEEISLLCIADQVHPALDHADQQRIADAMIAQCERLNDRFALLATKAGAGEVTALEPPRDTSYGAMYFPWLRVLDPVKQGSVLVPSVGHVAGIYARSDARWGVHRAPIALAVRGLAADDQSPLEMEVTGDEFDRLQRLGINAIRRVATTEATIGHEVQVASALTMSVDSQWKHVGARRLTLFVLQAIQLGTRWVRFERNDERLWERVRREITEFLVRLWKHRALLGTTPEEAFFVRCDRTTMTENDILNGRLVCLIGWSLVEPATSVFFTLTLEALPPELPSPPV